jgi:sodium-independent sulfate anion transporter 11
VYLPLFSRDHLTHSLGFIHAGPPPLSKDLIQLVLPELPAIVIILVIEHVAIAKSFGRTFGYDVVPSQEILAQGASNLVGTLVGGYACTGSFGASAVLSKAGVRTPLAGLFSALILVLALYALTTVFFYIPLAALAGLIIHAVVDLPTPPKTLYKYWKLSPLEFVLWWIGVLLAIFVSLETSIYVTIGISLAILLIRLARGRGHFVGRTRVYHYQTPAIITSPGASESDLASRTTMTEQRTASLDARPVSQCFQTKARDIYLPIDHRDASNPDIEVTDPYPGVFIYQFPSGFNYTNQAQHIQRLVSYVKSHTRPSGHQPSANSARLWSDFARTETTQASEGTARPILRAVVLDCTAVDAIDITTVQGLVDARRALERHACQYGDGASCDGRCVQWHFAGLSNPWTRRALAVAGFGAPAGLIERPGARAEDQENILGGWEPVYVVASPAASPSDGHETEKGQPHKGLLPVHGVDRPFFHVDLIEAVDAAVREARRIERLQKRVQGYETEDGVGDESATANARM